MTTNDPSTFGASAVPPSEPGTDAESRYQVLQRDRRSYLERARAYAELTIPTLLPPEGSTHSTIMPEAYQSFGARLTTSLASKLMVAFLPPGIKSFKLTVSNRALQAGLREDKDVEQGLTLTEDAYQRAIDKAGWRATTFVGLQHLIVTGNYMEETLPDNRIKGYRLDQYVTARDPSGQLIEFITAEWFNEHTVPERLGFVRPQNAGDALIALYTWGVRAKDGSWKIHQEFQGKRVDGSEGTFADDKTMPFRALRWTEVWGEHYGRSKIEEHYPDLRAVDGLSKAMLDGAAMASRNITMIRPNAAGGLNLRRRLTRADNGDYLIGNPEDVEMKQFTNVQGMQFTDAYLQSLKQELAAAFLLNSAARRDAERVTAFELRKMIEEIESVLGGVFTSLQDDIQQGRMDRLVFQMKAKGEAPPLPDGVVDLTILTGLEALARERDVERVSAGGQLLQGIPPEIAQDYIKWPEFLGKGMNGLGLPDVVNTEDEARQRREERLQREIALQAAGQLAGQATQTPEEA